MKAEPPSPPDSAGEPGRRWRRWLVLGISVALVFLVGAFLIIRPIIRRAPAISLGVLPFQNLSGDPGQEYLSQGLTEELITQLGTREGGRMRVVALRSVRPQGVTETLSRYTPGLALDYLLKGTVRRSGDRVRVVVHLVRALDEGLVWDESYDRDMKDLLNLQIEVAGSIAAGLDRKLAARPAASRTLHPGAYEAHLRGRFHWNQRTPAELLKALEDFERACVLDPLYAPPYVGIADCYTLLGSAEMGALPPREAMPRAKAAVEKALALDPNLAEAHATLAHLNLVYDWDREGAEREFRKALALNPGYATGHQWYALLLSVSGRSEEALAELGRAAALDPRSPTIQAALAEATYFARRYGDAEAHARKALELDPASMLGRLNLGRALVMQGRLDEGIAVFRTARELSGQAPGMTMFLGWAWGMKGDRARAWEMLAALEHPPERQGRPLYVPPVFLAALHGSLQNMDAMLADLERAREERCDYLIYLAQDPMADPARSDPRFVALLKKTGLG